MKVVLFCGGLGTRIRDEAENLPKPMVTVGYRPILWHVMRYYAYHGHKDFILCLGYKADVIKRYFLEYDETVSNDFVLAGTDRSVSLVRSDIQDWRITFVDTGMGSNIGQRLRAVSRHLEGEAMFLANYADGVSDLPLPAMIEAFRASDAVASFVSVRPTGSFHVVSHDDRNMVTAIGHVGDSPFRINGGFFVFRPAILDEVRPGEELVEHPFQRLIAAGKLVTYPYDGFWACMDTFKERQLLEDMHARGDTPWMPWRKLNGSSLGKP